MLESIQEKLGNKVHATWSAGVRMRGEMVHLYRQYDDGEHRDGLTTRQKTQLGIAQRTLLDQFNINYMPMIIGKMADRLSVTEIEVEVQGQSSDEPTEHQVYLDRCRSESRFDELQVSVHEAAIRDGYTFVVTEYDADEDVTRWVHEDAYDSDSETGVIPVLNAVGELSCAIKIWNEAYTEGSTKKRVNVYHPGVVEKYETDGDGKLVPYTDDDTDENGLVWWTDTSAEAGDPLGLPIHMFSNNPKKRYPFGQSELHNGIPLQDAANWELVDLVMSSRLTAFPLRKAKGFVPEGDAAPGDYVIFGSDTDDAALLSAMDVDIVPQGELVPFLEAITHIEDRLSVITRTPIPSSMGSSAQSGEALKERQTMLVEKVNRAQVLFGNVWEDIARMSIRLRQAFGAGLTGEVIGFSTRWKPAQIRNDADVMMAAQIMRDAGYEREFLRLMGQLPYLGYDDKKIDLLMEEKMAQAGREQSLLGIPGFGGNVTEPVRLAS